MEEKEVKNNLNANPRKGAKISLILLIAIILIIILIIGVFLVLGPNIKFTHQNSLSEQCAFACNTNQASGFCDFNRRLNKNTVTTCDELATNPKYSKYNVQVCPTISCESLKNADRSCVSGLKAAWTTPDTNGNCPAQENKFVKKLSPSDSPPIKGQICCYYYTL